MHTVGFGSFFFRAQALPDDRWTQATTLLAPYKGRSDFFVVPPPNALSQVTLSDPIEVAPEKDEAAALALQQAGFPVVSNKVSEHAYFVVTA